MQVLMSSRRTVMSGEVVTFAAEFEPWDSAFGKAYKAKGPFEVSASRDAVIVHHAECKTSEENQTLTTAIQFAEAARIRLAPTWRGGAPSKYPNEPTPCETAEVELPGSGRAALAAQPAEPCMDTVLRNAARRSATIVDRGRLVQPVEPVAWLHIQGNHTEPSLWRLDADEITRGWTEVPLYAAPPAPAAVPLTNEQIDEIWDGTFRSEDPNRKLSFRQIITRAIERAHGIATAGDKP